MFLSGEGRFAICPRPLLQRLGSVDKTGGACFKQDDQPYLLHVRTVEGSRIELSPPTPPIGGLPMQDRSTPQPLLPIRINCEENLIFPNATITMIAPFGLAVYGYLPAISRLNQGSSQGSSLPLAFFKFLLTFQDILRSILRHERVTGDGLITPLQTHRRYALPGRHPAASCCRGDPAGR